MNPISPYFGLPDLETANPQAFPDAAGDLAELETGPPGQPASSRAYSDVRATFRLTGESEDVEGLYSGEQVNLESPLADWERTGLLGDSEDIPLLERNGTTGLEDGTLVEAVLHESGSFWLFDAPGVGAGCRYKIEAGPSCLVASTSDAGSTGSTAGGGGDDCQGPKDGATADGGSTGGGAGSKTTTTFAQAYAGGWANANNAKAADGLAADYTADGSIYSGYLELQMPDGNATGMGVPPGATIDGVEARIIILESLNAGSDPTELTAGLTDGALGFGGAGSPLGTEKVRSGNFNTASYPTLGSPTDLWGATLTPAHFNAGGFGIRVKVKSTGGPVTFLIYHVYLTVYYHEAVGGGTAWTNPADATEADGDDASVDLTAGDTSEVLLVTGFGFTIPVTATITGILVEALLASTSGDPGCGVYVYLTDGTLDSDVQTAAAPFDAGYTAFGGPGDTWGLGLTPSEANSSSFGVGIVAGASDEDATVSVDHVRVTICYHTESIVIGGGGAGDGESTTLVYKQQFLLIDVKACPPRVVSRWCVTNPVCCSGTDENSGDRGKGDHHWDDDEYGQIDDCGTCTNLPDTLHVVVWCPECPCMHGWTFDLVLHEDGFYVNSETLNPGGFGLYPARRADCTTTETNGLTYTMALNIRIDPCVGGAPRVLRQFDALDNTGYYEVNPLEVRTFLCAPFYLEATMDTHASFPETSQLLAAWCPPGGENQPITLIIHE